MKYFVNAEEREASGSEDYVEFWIPGSEKSYWDKDSLYMIADGWPNSCFGDFFLDFVLEHEVFELDEILSENWQLMVSDAEKVGGKLLEIIRELQTWIEPLFARGIKEVYFIDANERFELAGIERIKDLEAKGQRVIELNINIDNS